jgi:hypothetical protein
MVRIPSFKVSKYMKTKSMTRVKEYYLLFTLQKEVGR